MVIAQTPMSGPPGTTFVQWGTGFSANSTAVLHFQRPDGTEDTPLEVSIDGSGHFEVSYTAPWNKPAGAYTWWGIDGPTGQESNRVTYTITSAGNSSLQGKVYDVATKAAVAGATVGLGSRSAVTGADGSYAFLSLASGQYSVKVSKSGYAAQVESIYVAPSSKMQKDFWLSSASTMAVTGVSSQYSGHVYFLDGYDHYVDYAASVYWAGHTPSKIRFTTPKGSYDVATSGIQATKRFNMGTEFGVCGKLKVKAIAAGGQESPEVTAEVSVMDNPLGPLGLVAPLLLRDMGDSFNYNVKAGIDMSLISAGVDVGVIPESIPFFGKEALKLDFAPSLEVEVQSAGECSLKFQWADLSAKAALDKEWEKEHDPRKILELLEDYMQQGKMDRGKLPKASVAGFEISLYPYVEFDGEFSDAACSWLWGGQLGLAGELELKASRPFIVPSPIGPIPMYLKGSIKVGVDAALELLELDPFELNGSLGLDPEVRASVGAGVDAVAAIEGWIGGGGNFGFQWPATPTLNEAKIYINAGITVYAFLFNWEAKGLLWDWDKFGPNGCSLLSVPQERFIAPTLAPRNYLGLPYYGAFAAGRQSRTAVMETKGVPYAASQSLLQATVFPKSESTLSSSGNYLHLSWLYDNPSRTAINRTMALFSSWNGSAWSTPIPIQDDGTADFHPALLTFPNGVSVAAWENEKAVLPATAGFPDMLKNLEISVARYSPATKQWLGARKLTSNSNLDRSPRLAGVASNNVLLTWISNSANDARGSAAAPNVLKFTRWNGTAWSSLKNIATIPYGILRYDVAFDGAKAWVVMSLDTDNDPSTLDDHELFLLSYSGGVWGSLQRLTTDATADENPQLAIDPDGDVVLAWLKGGKLVSAKNFDLSSPSIIFEDEYSTNLSDFKLASTATGKTAVTWAEPSQYSSDIYATFFDPVFGVWGSPKPLTSDSETESYLTAAFRGEKNLVVVYDRTQVSVRQTSRKDMSGKMVAMATPVPGTTDLYMSQYTLGGDLALAQESFFPTPLNPRPGEAVTLKVNAVNNGDSAVQNIPVAFYKGNPASGGIEIGRVAITDVLNPGAEAEVSIEWTVPAATTPIAVFAVIDPERQVADRNRSNNVVRRPLSMADLVLYPVTWDQVFPTMVTVTARVTNRGAVPSAATDITFRRDSLQGQILSTQAVSRLGVDKAVEAALTIDTTSYPVGEIVVYAIVDESESVVEFDKTNNTERIVIPKN